MGVTEATGTVNFYRISELAPWFWIIVLLCFSSYGLYFSISFFPFYHSFAIFCWFMAFDQVFVHRWNIVNSDYVWKFDLTYNKQWLVFTKMICHKLVTLYWYGCVVMVLYHLIVPNSMCWGIITGIVMIYKTDCSTI
jgi:hypothetical protein